MVFPSASGHGETVRQAALVGIVEARVHTVVVTRADGADVEAELVAAGERGFRFFAYAADTPSGFPVAYRAYGADGGEVKGEDVRAAITPPRGGAG